jgi:hypothetical protein
VLGCHRHSNLVKTAHARATFINQALFVVKEKGSKYQGKHTIGLRYVSDLLWLRRLKSATIKEGEDEHIQMARGLKIM